MTRLLNTCAASLAALATFMPFGADASTRLLLKQPGGAACSYELKDAGAGRMITADNSSLPLKITRTAVRKADGTTDLTLTVEATEKCRFNIAETSVMNGTRHEACEFYMPGFWYHHNLRSPENAPSFRTSDSWVVREDRLSTPLTGIYDPATKRACTVVRTGSDCADCIVQNQSGDVILPAHTSVGFTGFRNEGGMAALEFGYPYIEAPKRYIRKLTLIDPIRTFETIEKGEKRTISWQLREFQADDYSDFVADVWNYSYDTFAPEKVSDVVDGDGAKSCLANYFRESYVDKYDLKYFSGAGLRTDDCNNTGDYEVGFVGRVLLNAYNALEHGRKQADKDLVEKANAIFESTLEHGFTPEGYFREAMHMERGWETDVMSIRRQSEGVFAILNYLDTERRLGNRHPQWEAKMKSVLDRILSLQDANGSFPRKFKGSGEIVDRSGGSTPSATLPLVMAYSYFKDKRYLESARRTAGYLEHELIDKADYFSSTLDANCEDKEASLYASTAMHYLTYVTKGKEREHYMDLCRKSAYFCLSWYYMWDVPFAPGQMLGDVGFRSRGWGNVSVENNHIDVFIFEFATVLDKLSAHYNEPRFAGFSEVIRSSMLQLLPKENNMFDIAKAGFYPEVVQHTTWDYGRNGKGFYNDIFAPGWTVASLWQMLSPDRVDNFFAKR